MVGHSFGLVSAVYNYNRRSAAINGILVKLFGWWPLASTMTIMASSPLHQPLVPSWWLNGFTLARRSVRSEEAPTVIEPDDPGRQPITWKLMQLEIKKERREDLLDEIGLSAEIGFARSTLCWQVEREADFRSFHLWGKVGRAFLRSISERQYCKFPASGEFKLGRALEESLRQWRKLVDGGPPRPTDVAHERLSDAVIFTDGFTPDPRSPGRLPDRIGAVLFDRRLNAPRQFTAVVPDQVKKFWCERTTQIVPSEMLAPIVALQTFADRVRGADVILLIDSEAVVGALIKGYSCREDICLCISIFWDLALSLRARIFYRSNIDRCQSGRLAIP